jgi:hypothetical protein
VNGKVTEIGALYTAKVDVNGLIGGFGVYNDGTSVQAGFDADLFWVGKGNKKRKPFIIDTGTGETYIDDAVINKITFNKLRSADGNLIVDSTTGKMKAQYLDAENLTVRNAQSINYSAGVAGWKLSSNGTFQMVGNSSSGKTIQDFNGIRVYDSSGVVRVKIGNLLA